MIDRYFSNIELVEQPKIPDLSEPVQKKQKIFTKTDTLANRPALAFAYHVPERNTQEYYAMGLIDQILLQGQDSKLYQELVKKRGITGSVDGGINLLGNMLNYNGPMLWTSYLLHDSTVTVDSILSVVDAIIEDIRSRPVDQSTLDRALVKIRSGIYSNIESFFGFGRADLLASFALFDGEPEKINEIEEKFKSITPGMILKTAQKYLRPEARTVLAVIPKQ